MLKIALSSALLLGLSFGLYSVGHAQSQGFDFKSHKVDFGPGGTSSGSSGLRSLDPSGPTTSSAAASNPTTGPTVQESKAKWEAGQTVDVSPNWVEIGPFNTFTEAREAWTTGLNEFGMRLPMSIVTVDHGGTYRIHVFAPEGNIGERIASDLALYNTLPSEAREYMADPNKYVEKKQKEEAERLGNDTYRSGELMQSGGQSDNQDQHCRTAVLVGCHRNKLQLPSNLKKGDIIMNRIATIFAALLLGLLVSSNAHAQGTVKLGIPFIAGPDVNGGPAPQGTVGPWATAMEAMDFGREVILRGNAVSYNVVYREGGYYCQVRHNRNGDDGGIINDP